MGMPHAKLNMLKIHNLIKTFGGVKAIDKLSFQVEEGEITALIGPNGAGKTTLFDVIGGFVKPDEGKILFQGREITFLSPSTISQLGIGRTFQDIRIFPQMSVLDNVMIPMRYSKGGSLFAALLNKPEMIREDIENRERAIELLEIVGLSSKSEDFAGNLSHGQRKLLEISRTLALDSKLFLLDEPMAGLFPDMVEKMKRILRSVREEGKTVLFIEHDMKAVSDLSDSVIVLNLGMKLAQGTPVEILNDESVIEAYLGLRAKEKLAT